MIKSHTIFLIISFLQTRINNNPILKAKFEKDQIKNVAIYSGHSLNCYKIRLKNFRCWGSDQFGEAELPVRLSNQSILFASIGRQFICVLTGVSERAAAREVAKEGGGSNLSCWGNSDWEQTAVPEQFETSSVQVKAGDWHTCAIDTGMNVRCWGWGGSGQLDIDAHYASFVVSVAARNETTCVLLEFLALECFGKFRQESMFENTNNELTLYVELGYNHICTIQDKVICESNEDLGKEYGQIAMPMDETWEWSDMRFATQGNHTCGINKWLKIVCWGQDDHGQTSLLSNNKKSLDIPKREYQSVAVGDKHTCALFLAFYVQCWGLQRHNLSTVPSVIEKWVHRFSLGGLQSCIVRMGAIICSGRDKSGLFKVPAQIQGQVSELAAGYSHICAFMIQSDGFKTMCWGLKEKELIRPPAALQQDMIYINIITSGFKFSCALQNVHLPLEEEKENMLICWGLDSHGQTDPPKVDRAYLDTVDAGMAHACLKQGYLQQLACWGHDDHKQTQVPLTHSINVLTFSTGYYHTCAVSVVGAARCWGANNTGQSDIPSGLGPAVAQIHCGGSHTCGIGHMGAVKCWGSDKDKQSTIPKYLVPQIFDLKLGNAHTCIVNTIGVVKCFGDNKEGQCNIQ